MNQMLYVFPPFFIRGVCYYLNLCNFNLLTILHSCPNSFVWIIKFMNQFSYVTFNMRQNVDIIHSNFMYFMPLLLMLLRIFSFSRIFVTVILRFKCSLVGCWIGQCVLSVFLFKISILGRFLVEQIRIGFTIHQISDLQTAQTSAKCVPSVSPRKITLSRELKIFLFKL